VCSSAAIPGLTRSRDQGSLSRNPRIPVELRKEAALLVASLRDRAQANGAAASVDSGSPPPALSASMHGRCAASSNARWRVER